MTTKRLRFEILRRDNHTCRYCGQSAPDVVLTVDHVVPQALGGSDDPTNLVAACVDCNAGKSSVPAGAPLVDDVQQHALTWGRAVEAWNDIQAAKRAEREAYTDAIDVAWTGYHTPGGSLPRPVSWMQTTWQFHKTGLPVGEVIDAIAIAMGGEKIRNENVWRYTCGVVWRKVEKMNDGAMSLLAEAAPDGDPNT